MWAQQQINLPAFSRGFHIITSYVIDSAPEIKNHSIGMLHLFIKHTSASIAINEGADPDVRVDFETHFNKLVPENSPDLYTMPKAQMICRLILNQQYWALLYQFQSRMVKSILAHGRISISANTEIMRAVGN